MKRLLPICALLALFSFGAVAADIVDTAIAAGNFNTLVAAVKAAGLVDTLKGLAHSPSLLQRTMLLQNCRPAPLTRF